MVNDRADPRPKVLLSVDGSGNYPDGGGDGGGVGFVDYTGGAGVSFSDIEPSMVETGGIDLSNIPVDTSSGVDTSGGAISGIGGVDTGAGLGSAAERGIASGGGSVGSASGFYGGGGGGQVGTAGGANYTLADFLGIGGAMINALNLQGTPLGGAIPVGFAPGETILGPPTPTPLSPGGVQETITPNNPALGPAQPGIFDPRFLGGPGAAGTTTQFQPGRLNLGTPTLGGRPMPTGPVASPVPFPTVTGPGSSIVQRPPSEMAPITNPTRDLTGLGPGITPVERQPLGPIENVPTPTARPAPTGPVPTATRSPIGPSQAPGPGAQPGTTSPTLAQIAAGAGGYRPGGSSAQPQPTFAGGYAASTGGLTPTLARILGL